MSRSYRFPPALALLITLAVFILAFSPVLSISISASPSRPPLILVPGLAGSRLENDPDGDGKFGEVWPNGDRLILDPWDRSLLALRLAPNGSDPYGPGREYTSVRVGDIIRREYTLDYYASTIAYFTGPDVGYVEGKDFFVCPYDWRKDIRQLAYGSLPNTLDGCISKALALNPGTSQVDILAHSMGGLVARSYISDPLRAARVRRLVTLGSPFLGAPKIALALLDKLCFVEWLGFCFSNTAVLNELIQNYPAGYQITPGESYFRVYPRGFIRRDRDTDGDGRSDGFLDPVTSYQLLEAHNISLAQAARLYHQDANVWANGGTNGVEVFAFVGDQHASIGSLVEYEQRPWYNPWGTPKIAYRAEVVNGDGTVPLHSADMRLPSALVDLSGGVPVLYFNLEHGELPKSPPVLALAAEIFSTPAFVDPDLLVASAQNLPELESSEAPRTTPLPLNGIYLSVVGPASVEVSDVRGQSLQSSSASRLDGGASPAQDLSGASLTELDEAVFIFLPEGGPYTLRLEGETPGRMQVRLQQIVSDAVSETALYSDLPVDENSQAVLSFASAATAGAFSLDLNGDGSFEVDFPPTARLNALESQDSAAPQVSILLMGTIASDGNFLAPVTVNIQAQDEAGGSGLLRLEYSLDGGKSTLEYRGPFQVDPETVEMILARAVDRAGNNAFAERPLLPDQFYLPLLSVSR